MTRIFSIRQKELIGLWLEGRTRQEIAKEMEITKRTVDFHLKNIMLVSGCKNWAEFGRKFGEGYKY